MRICVQTDVWCMTWSVLYQVNTPAESKYPWDYLNKIQTIPDEQALGPKAETKCVLWK